MTCLYFLDISFPISYSWCSMMERVMDREKTEEEECHGMSDDCLLSEWMREVSSRQSRDEEVKDKKTKESLRYEVFEQKWLEFRKDSKEITREPNEQLILNCSLKHLYVFLKTFFCESAVKTRFVFHPNSRFKEKTKPKLPSFTPNLISIIAVVFDKSSVHHSSCLWVCHKFWHSQSKMS